MERGLAALASVFTIIAAWLISDVFRSAVFDVMQAQLLSARATLGVGSAIVAAVLFGSAAIVNAINRAARRSDQAD